MDIQTRLRVGAKLLAVAKLLEANTYSKLYHVGDLSKPRVKPHFSLEGSGLSVSKHPGAWRQIAKLGGDLWQLSKKNPKFLLATKKNNDAAIKWSVENGWVVPAIKYQVSWYDDEMEDEMSFEVPTREEAEAEDQGEVKEIESFNLGPKGIAYWKEAFTSKPDNNMAKDFAIIWFAEHKGYDGVWWDETLDPSRLSAPRGVIFQSRLPDWTTTKVPEGTVVEGSTRKPATAIDVDYAKDFEEQSRLKDAQVERWEVTEEYPVANLLSRFRSKKKAQQWLDEEAENDDRGPFYIEDMVTWVMDSSSDMEEIVVIEDHTGKVVDIWDGWHRSAIAIAYGRRTLPAIIGVLKAPVVKASTQVEVHYANDNDSEAPLEDIYDLFKQAGVRLHSHYNEYLFIYQDDLMVAALGLATYQDNESVEFSVVTHRDHQRKGLASTLIDEAHKHVSSLSSELDWEKPRIEADVINDQALVPLLKNKGYQPGEHERHWVKYL